MLLHEKHSGKQGFTLIELLIVILIIAILMAVAMPLYLASIRKSETTTCRTNMFSIAQAEQAYRARVSSHVYTTNMTDLSADLGSTPKCPSQGTYSVVISDGSDISQNGALVPDGGLLVQCSNSSHGVFAPGVDSE